MIVFAYCIAALGLLAIEVIEKTVHYKPGKQEEKPMDGDWIHLTTLLL